MAFEISGIDELISLLGASADMTTVNEAVLSSLVKSGKEIQATAKLAVHVQTGELRGSIEVHDISEGNIIGVEIGSNVKQAVFEEYGVGPLGDPTVAHTTKTTWHYQDEDTKEWHTGKSRPPHPFLHPAFKAHEKNITQAVKTAVIQKMKG